MDNDAARRANEKESSAAAHKIKPPSLITTGREKENAGSVNMIIVQKTNEKNGRLGAPDDRLIVCLSVDCTRLTRLLNLLSFFIKVGRTLRQQLKVARGASSIGAAMTPALDPASGGGLRRSWCAPTSSQSEPRFFFNYAAQMAALLLFFIRP